MNTLLIETSDGPHTLVEIGHQRVNVSNAPLRARLLEYIQLYVGQRNHLTVKEVAMICQLSVTHVMKLMNRREIQDFRTSFLEGHVKRERRCVTGDALIGFLERQTADFLAYILRDVPSGGEHVA